jgi:hypothetical protein
MILELIAIYGAVKGGQKIHQWAEESDAAKADAANAIHRARTASRASRERVRQIIAEGRKRSAERRSAGLPWRAGRFGKALAGFKPGWTHNKPHDLDEYRLQPGHQMYRAWSAYQKAKASGDQKDWRDFKRIFNRDKARRETPTWDTPGDLYAQYAKARVKGQPFMDAEKVADKLGISTAEAERVMGEWREHYDRDWELWRPDREGARLIKVSQRRFTTPEEARAWADQYHCKGCGGTGAVVDAPEGDAWQFASYHRAGCKEGQDPAAYEGVRTGSEKATSSPATDKEEANRFSRLFALEQERYERLGKCIEYVGPGAMCGEPREEGSLVCAKHKGQQQATDAPAASEEKTDGGNMHGATPKYHDISGPGASGSGGTGIPSAADLFETAKAYIEAPIGRGLGEILERLAVIAHGITMLSAGGDAFKTLLDEYQVDKAIVDGVQSGFADVGRGAVTLVENAELGKGFYDELVKALQRTGGQIPDHAILNQDRQHA